MNTKDLGELSQAKIISRCLELGFSVSIPFGDNQRYDLILDCKDGTLLRVQCKTAWKVRNTLAFNTASTFPRGDRKRVSYNGQAELFLVYAPYNNKVYRVFVNEAPSTQMTINLEDGKIGYNIKPSKQFEF